MNCRPPFAGLLDLYGESFQKRAVAFSGSCNTMPIFNQGEHGPPRWVVGWPSLRSCTLSLQFSENLVSRIRHVPMLSVARRSISSCNCAFHWSIRSIKFTGSDIAFLGCAKAFTLLRETPAHSLQIQLAPWSAAVVSPEQDR